MLFKKDFNKNINKKIIVTDFKHLEPSIFKPVYNLTKKELVKEFILVASDGRLYINSKNELHGFFVDIFNILVAEDYTTLEAYKNDCASRYPDIKTFEDWSKMKVNNDERTQIFTMLIIPLEFKRREIESMYYNSVY